ncbi:hypothetical protein EMIHUDRAFT_245451 [Emiliania huxleyi CCMP1516]|uniref:Homologous-pairing protein 2 winged helix domain-containing protein n=2 Tax=Emiliania huxleyi TaxID=2903 RepID=A0A0D3IXA4_EMIH1|nr:hypothetical protein EMIHUDRAFT_245451 [Emiliania huxleyi CCMP1516]EOD15889.1 hypothetical protein EMIHUDRAFT_245451 [Emiliania huxleyi CCMP1516]|eukprot:XP_005768318.1 hypothetical protein EMIHUDRAFT_245451 [Emiliania huxleyi CCMP1516]
MYNKPVNAQLVADQFRASMTKPQAEKALAALAASGDAVLKENGKSKIYSANQQAAQLKAAERAASGRKSLGELMAQKKTIEARRCGWKGRERVWKKQAEVAALKGADGDQKPLSEKAFSESHEAVNAYSKLLKELKKRRRTCLDMVGHVAENTNKPDKKLIEEWGLETDEDAGFDLSKYPPLPASALHKASASTRPKPGGFGRR